MSEASGSSTAVVHKENPKCASPKWVVRGYTVHETVHNNDAEALAVIHDLQIALERISNDNTSPKAVPGSVVAIFTDSQIVLRAVRDYHELGGEPADCALVEEILIRATALPG